MTAPRAQPTDVEDSAYDLSTATGTIAGTLTRPPQAGRCPVVLIIAGSGPVDRDGNTQPYLRTDAYRLLARALAGHGIASVRYDKRAIGASAAAMKSESDLRFDDYVGDAAAWVAKLRGDGQFARIAIAGHSEGSLIGMIAAQRAPVDAFVSLEGAGYPAADVLRMQLAPQLAGAPDLAAASARILEALLAGRVDADVPVLLGALYRPSVQPYLISWFRYDPRAEIAKVPASVTVVQGTADFQVPVDHGEALAAAHPGSALVLVPGMSHVLKAADKMAREQQIQTVYVDPSIPLDPAVTEAVVHAIA
jgi:pimeloyl-ACP methyl ester carboxylesterase